MGRCVNETSEKSSTEGGDEEFLARLVADGYMLEGRKQEAVESEARNVLDRARGAGLKFANPESESSRDISTAMNEVDRFLFDALECLRSCGIDKPLTPLAWMLFNMPINEKDPVDLAVAFRAADSQMLVTRFSQETDPSTKEDLKKRLRLRSLIRRK